MSEYESIKLNIPKSWPQWMVERYLTYVCGFHNEVYSRVELARAAAMIEAAYGEE